MPRLSLLSLLLLLLVSCGGGGGGSAATPAAPTPPPPTYSISGTAQGIPEGSNVSIVLESPPGIPRSQLLLTENGPFTFDWSLQEGASFRVRRIGNPDIISSTLYCAVPPNYASGTVASADIDSIVVDCASRLYSIEGDLYSSDSVLVDTDINDPNALAIDNSSFDTAQVIYSPSTVHGFLTAEPTGNSDNGDAFAGVADVEDFFFVTLGAGQAIRLDVIDHEGLANGNAFEGDLDLFLFDPGQEGKGQSISAGPTEEIIVPDDGDYYVKVEAVSGTSSYILSISENTGGTGMLSRSQSFDFVPGEAIVRMRPGYRPLAQQNARMMNSLSLSHRNDGRASLARFDTATTASLFSPAGNVRALSRSQNEDTNRKMETLRHIKRLQQSPGVEYAEPNYLRRAMAVPNDDVYGQQWSLPMMNLPAAWDITTGIPASDEIIVAIVDTGIFLAHPELENQLVTGYDFISDPDNANDGEDAGGDTDIDPNPDDPGDAEVPGVDESSWHGTHVAGIVAAETNNASGMAGVAWGTNAKLMPLRVLGTQGGTSYDLMQALRYAAGMPNDSETVPSRPADIINLSLGGYGWSEAEKELLEEIYDQGIVVVASAGNDSHFFPAFPASYASVLSVGAVDNGENLASYSNFGLTIDLVAPGGDAPVLPDTDPEGDEILSTTVDDSVDPREGVLGYKSGTSMAAPHVAGMLALMKAVYPELTAEVVRDLLHDGQLTRDLGDPGFDGAFGFGLADALKAVEAVQHIANNTAPLPPTAPPFLIPAPFAIPFLADSPWDLLSQDAVFIFNKGGGNPLPTDISTSEPWLQAEYMDYENPGLLRLYVRADWANMLPGNYFGEVTVSFDTHSPVTIPVVMTIDELLPSGQLGQVYVTLLSADENMNNDPFSESPRMQVFDSTSSYYSFNLVRPGSYYLVVGSDLNNDGLICTPGESCSVYPSLANPEVIVIDENLEDAFFFAPLTLDILREPLSVPGLPSGGIPRE